jgi:hypothetical protein
MKRKLYICPKLDMDQEKTRAHKALRKTAWKKKNIRVEKKAEDLRHLKSYPVKSIAAEPRLAPASAAA